MRRRQPFQLERCERCKFAVTSLRTKPLQWGQFPGATYNPADLFEVLVCKRMPPTADKDGFGVSPEVGPGNFCGEFKEKEGAR